MKRKIFKKALLVSVLLSVFFAFVNKTQAAVRCETQYGGDEVCVKTGELQINKKVWDKEKSEFVDNLGITTYKFSSGEEIVFKLEIKNVGDETFDKVSVSDSLPSYLELVSGETYFEIADLSPDEVETREIKAKVVSSERLPYDKTLICVINQAEVWSGDEKDKDTSQVCIEKKVLGITTIPVTGPENWLILSSLAFLAILSGLTLIRKNQAE